MSDDFFSAYAGQTTDELLALETRYRIDSLVQAFETAIALEADQAKLSREETWILAIEALEREVNNGGYDQFFLNSSSKFDAIIVEALLGIGCPLTAAITREAIALHQRAELDDDAVLDALCACDERYYAACEPIDDRLFAWIKQNRSAIRIGRPR